METQPESDRAQTERGGEHNALDYRNVDEEQEHDERGSQGDTERDVPPGEE